jgi:ribokinase
VLSITHPDGDRTIMVVGDRLQPRADDALPWDRLAACGACYYAGEDPQALVRAREAPVLVVTARRVCDIREAGVLVDVVVGSAADPDEDASGLSGALAPAWTVTTRGAGGGLVRSASGGEWTYEAMRPPGTVVDTYGCGDTFAGCLAAFLGRGEPIEQAVRLAAREAARCATWRGGPGPTR